jgi:hypothetical protein
MSFTACLWGFRLRVMRGGSSRHAELAGELVEWWEDLCELGTGSRVVLVAVPSGWGRTAALDHLAAAAGSADAPVTLVARINGAELLEHNQGVQAAAVIDRLAKGITRHEGAEFVGLDRLGGVAQLGLGVGGLFVSGLGAAVGFLVAGVALAGAGKIWDDSPAGQDGALARAARAVAATSLRVPVVVIVDDADLVDRGLALTLIENLADRWGGQVLVVAAVNPGGSLATALTARGRQGVVEGLVRIAEADPDMSSASRAALVRELCPELPDVAVRTIARRTGTFADVFAVTASPRLAELRADQPDAEAAAAVEAALTGRLRPALPSPEAVIIAWAGGLLHARQAAQAMSVRGLARPADSPADVHRWDHLERPANATSSQLTAQVADLATADRQAMARVLLAEAAAIIADRACGPVDRIAAARAVHRTRADLADRTGLPAVQRQLTADLEALRETAAALEIAAKAVAEWPAAGDPADRDWLAAAVLRLTQRTPAPALTPLAESLIDEAATAGAAIGLEARIWAAVALLGVPDGRNDALSLIDQLAADLDQHGDLGTAGEQWRLLLAFHAGRSGYPAIAQRLLTPLLTSADPARQGTASAVLHAVTGPGAGIRLQNAVLKAELAALPPEADDDLLRIHHALAANHDVLGEYQQALIHGQYELALRTAIQSSDHPDFLTTRGKIAAWTGDAGDARGALRLFQELAPDQERVFGPLTSHTFSTRANIASWTGRSGDAADALRLCLELQPDMERILGAQHAETLRNKGNIAYWTGQCGDAASAVRLFRELQPEIDQVLGPDHPDTLTNRGNIASWAGQSGDAAGALRLSLELQPDMERILGPEHPETLDIRANIAFWTGSSGDIAGGLRLSQELLSDRERVLGPDHPAVLSSRANLAFWTGQNGDAADTLRLYRELVPDMERVNGPHHPDTLSAKASIASLTGRCGDPAGALRLSQDLLPELRQVLGPDHHQTLIARGSIASLTSQCGDTGTALRLSVELLPDLQRVFGPDHQDTLTARSNIAFWTSQCGDAAGGLHLYLELLPDMERVLGPDHLETLTTRRVIAALTAECGDGAGALRLLQELLPDIERVFGPDHPNVLATRRAISSATGE